MNLDFNVCVRYSHKAMSWRIVDIQETTHGEEVHVVLDRENNWIKIPAYDFFKRKGVWTNPKHILRDFWVTKREKIREQERLRTRDNLSSRLVSQYS